MTTRRSERHGLHVLEVEDCPIAVVAGVAAAARVGATVENLRPVATLDWFATHLALPPGAPARGHRVRNARFDVALGNAAFLELLPFWDTHGVYALFTERSPIAFRASDLPPASRYRALANAGFVLEIALAGPTSGPVSEFVSPQSELIDLARALAASG